MTLQIGAVAPDFEAETTDGRIKFHDWIGNSWALLRARCLPGDKHAKWSDDIRETQGAAPNFPMIGDTKLNVSQ
jgi:alkyl hydroperoxide reductase subunit AhpC